MTAVLTYTTIAGDVIDLTELSPEERAHFDRCYLAFRQGMDVGEFRNQLVYGIGNPQLQDTAGWVTAPVWHSPLFRAISDFGARLGIRQGRLLPEGDWEGDPIQDEWITAAEAAKRKGVTRGGLQHAIKRGTVIARPEKPGGSNLAISVRSLDRWQPQPHRQANGRKGGAALAARR